MDAIISKEDYKTRYALLEKEETDLQHRLAPLEDNEDIKSILNILANIDTEIDLYINSKKFDECKIDWLFEHTKRITVVDKHLIIELDLIAGAILAGKDFSLFVMDGLNNLGHSLSFGYLIDAALNNHNLDKKVQFKILCENGRIKIYESANKVAFDGSTYKGEPDKVINRLKKNGTVAPQLICYGVNNEGMIRTIDTVDASTKVDQNDSLKLLYTSGTSNLYHISKAMSFGGKINYTKNTVFFCVPQNVKNADDWKFFILPQSKLYAGDYKAAGYSINTGGTAADVIVLYDMVPTGSKGISVVKEISDVLNSKGEITKCITLETPDKEVSLTAASTDVVTKAKSFNYSDSAYYSLEVGDAIRYNLNIDGEVMNIRIVYDKSEGMVNGDKVLGEGYKENLRIIDGAAYHVADNIIQVVAYGNESNPDLTMADMENHLLSNFTIIVYSSDSQNKVFKGTISDIKTYFNNGSKCSRVIVQTAVGVGELLYVIND